VHNSDAIRLLFRLACFLPLVGGLMLIEWISEQPPVHSLLTSQLQLAVDALISGNTIWSGVDMLDLKPLWIEHLHSRPEILVLGSSRLVEIPTDWFGPHSMLNGALLRGDFEDAVSVFQLCLETGKTPQLVLLELNPTLTFEGKSLIPPALAPYFRRALLHYGILPPTFFSELFSLEGLRWDTTVLLQHPEWRISEEPVPGAYRMHPDGTTDWRNQGTTPDEVERAVIANMRHLDPTRRHWQATSQPGWFDLKILRAFLDDLQSRGIRVVVLLVPVHPAAFDYYVHQGGYDESWIRREMGTRGIAVIGSYSPWVAKTNKSDFFDDVHVHRSVLHRLLKAGGIIK
jgi:hypothetical protein